MRKHIIAWFAVACVLLVGCSVEFEYQVDHGQCLAAHNDVTLIPQYMPICDSKGICTMQFSHFLPITTEVCDRWEFPEGRPRHG